MPGFKRCIIRCKPWVPFPHCQLLTKMLRISISSTSCFRVDSYALQILFLCEFTIKTAFSPQVVFYSCSHRSEIVLCHSIIFPTQCMCFVISIFFPIWQIICKQLKSSSLTLFKNDLSINFFRQVFLSGLLIFIT